MTNSLRKQVIESVRFAEARARGLIEGHTAAAWPLYTVGGKWRFDHGGSEAAAAGAAEMFVVRLARCFADGGVADDVGFWREKEDRYGKSSPGGQELARRFQPNGQYLASAIGADSLRIESMVEVGALFDAATAASDGPLDTHELRRRAMQHCLTVQRVLCRGDGSVAEEGTFDPRTGEFLRQVARRAYRGDSCWSAAVAWTMYGFAACYEKTGDRRFLKTAEDQAEFWMSVTPDHGVPPWDFDAPLDGKLTLTQPDSGAAAAAACGLFELSRLTHDRVRARAYEEFAMRTVETLTQLPYLASDEPGWEGILKRGVYDMRGGAGVDESVLAGDAFFVEAMTRALGLL
jgi:unsaturated chondroitin disaccharide hydrolase